MNNYEDWAHLVARKLKGEADVIAAIDREELDDSAAAEAFVRTVLEPFLPENYGIGAGRIVDAFGNRSDFMDVVVYNRSFPRIGLRGTQSDFLYEAVLASFVIRAKYVRKTFFESMDACASMARLVTNVDKSVLVQLARKNGLKPGPNKTFIHEDPLRTARFELIGSPPVFMFGFTGIKQSYRQLQENIELWIEQHTAQHQELPMRAFPAVIATQGCYAWRNAAPLALSNREMLGVGNDEAPIRLIILQLLYLLNRRLNVTTDGYGLKPNLSAYLSQFKPPKFELGIGDVDALVKLRLSDDQKEKTQQDKRLKSARDHSARPDASKPAATPAAEAPKTAKPKPSPAKAVKPAAEPAPAPIKPAEPEASAPAAEEPADDKTPSFSGVFTKPSPFSSAPPAESADTQAEAEAPKPYKAPTTPLGSAPIPGVDSSSESVGMPEVSMDPPSLIDLDDEPEPESKPAAAPLGSAPIPSVVPPKPDIDIELTGDDLHILDEVEAAESKADEAVADEPDFESTMVITPDATLSQKPAASSADAFIDKVKEQLSSSDAAAEEEEDPFVQTTRL